MGTSKKAAGKAKREAKEARILALQRTRDERAKEVVTLRSKIMLFGFPTECEGMIEVEKLFAQYIESEESVSGKASFAEWDRLAEVILPIRRDIEATIILRYTGSGAPKPISEAAIKADAELAKSIA